MTPEEEQAAREKEVYEGPARRQKAIDEGIATRQKEYDEGPQRRQEEIDKEVAARQKEYDEGPQRRQKAIDEGIAARQKKYDEVPIPAAQDQAEPKPRDREQLIKEGAIQGPAMAERHKQEREAALNKGETGGPVAEQHGREEKAVAEELGHIPGPGMEAQKMEEKGQAQAAGEIPGPAMEQAKKGDRQKEIESGQLPGPTMGRTAQQGAEATEEHTKATGDKLAADIQQARTEGRIITGVGKAAGMAAEQKHEALVDQGKIPGEAMDAQKKEDAQRSKTEGTTGDSAVARRQQEMEQAADEGRTEPRTPQQVAETRRSETKEQAPQVSSSSAAVPMVPPATLPKPADPVGRPVLSASEWNGAVNTNEVGYIPLIYEQSVAKGGLAPQGRFTNRAHVRGMNLHPWLIQPYWDAELELTKADQDATGRKQGAWCATVAPGFINGYAPAISVKRGYLPEKLSVYGNDYGKKDITDNDTTVQVILTDTPAPFLRLINMADSRSKVIGANGSINNGIVPLFFRAQGAFKPEPITEDDILSNVINAAAQSDTLAFNILNNQTPSFNLGSFNQDDGLPEGTRYLYRADVVLQIDRPALKQNYEFDSIGLLRLTGFDITLPIRNLYSARLYTTPIWFLPEEPTVEDITSGGFNDRNFDELVIGTVYLLSPTADLMPTVPTQFGGTTVLPPDGTWMAWVEHQVFWNLNYCAITQVDPVGIDTSLDYFTQILGVLAGGVGYLIALSYVNPIEAQYNQILNALSQSIVRGEFWTG